MHNVVLLVRQVTDKGLEALYVREGLELPFVPTVGMRFQQGVSTWLWETGKGELMPSVESVTYDLDEQYFVCVLTVDQPLNSSFWTRVDLESLANSVYMPYIQRRG